MNMQEQRSIQVDVHNFKKQISEASELIPKLQENLESFLAEELLARTAHSEMQSSAQQEQEKHSIQSQEVTSYQSFDMRIQNVCICSKAPSHAHLPFAPC